MPGGYAGKLLRVDLSSGQVRDESLPPEDVLKRYVGGVGLGVKFLCDEVPPQVGPFDVENRLIFMTGPLTGMPVPCSTCGAVVSINADTGFTVGAAFTHGRFASYLKFAGYDGIIVQGTASSPVCLWIHDGQCEIKEVGGIWGKDTHATEDLVREKIGEPRASVAAIGPAGENLIKGACIANDKHHLAAFGGLGAVMGSKKLKAIAVFGKGTVPVARPQELVGIAKQWWERVLTQQPPHDLWQAGITRNWRIMGDISTVACRNLLSPERGREVAYRFAAACEGYQVTPKPCLGCPIACSYKVVVTSGERKGLVGTMAGGAESMEGAAVTVGVEDPADIIWLTDYYDRQGLNSCTIGCAIALAFECYEKGIITREDTGGLELNWGNAEAARKLVDQVVSREGLGRVLAEGPKKAAQHFENDADKSAVWVKGASIRLHDYRGRFGHMLTAAVNGAVRVSGSPFMPPDFSTEGVAARVRKSLSQGDFADSLGVCMFALRSGFAANLPDILGITAAALGAVTGWETWTTEEMLTIGERIENLERLFNIGRGLRPADDLDVSPRLLEPPADGVCQGKSVASHLRDLVSEYYRLMGWDLESGAPLSGTLERLGLG